jgi:hypothetical protein
VFSFGSAVQRDATFTGGASVAGSGFMRIWNGVLFTIPTTIDEKL